MHREKFSTALKVERRREVGSTAEVPGGVGKVKNRKGRCRSVGMATSGARLAASFDDNDRDGLKITRLGAIARRAVRNELRGG
jgi:hypothetical protein